MLIYHFGYTFEQIQALTKQQVAFLLGGLHWYLERVTRRRR